MTSPCNLFFLVAVESPKSDGARVHSNHLSGPPRLRMEFSMTKETADEARRLMLAHSQTNQAVSGVAKVGTVIT